MTTTPNPLAARLTGILLGVIQHGTTGVDRSHLLAVLEKAHRDFPMASSDDIFKIIEAVKDKLKKDKELELLHEYEEERRRDELERFRDLDGDHDYERAERGPEHEYPR